MEILEFVYTTYIRTTPERLWQALTDPAFTRRWWHDHLRDGLEGGIIHDLGQRRHHHRRSGADRPRI